MHEKDSVSVVYVQSLADNTKQHGQKTFGRFVLYMHVNSNVITGDVKAKQCLQSALRRKQGQEKIGTRLANGAI